MLKNMLYTKKELNIFYNINYIKIHLNVIYETYVHKKRNVF